jgi:hypothetical protein
MILMPILKAYFDLHGIHTWIKHMDYMNYLWNIPSYKLNENISTYGLSLITKSTQWGNVPLHLFHIPMSSWSNHDVTGHLMSQYHNTERAQRYLSFVRRDNISFLNYPILWHTFWYIWWTILWLLQLRCNVWWIQNILSSMRHNDIIMVKEIIHKIKTWW